MFLCYGHLNQLLDKNPVEVDYGLPRDCCLIPGGYIHDDRPEIEYHPLVFAALHNTLDGLRPHAQTNTYEHRNIHDI